MYTLKPQPCHPRMKFKSIRGLEAERWDERGQTGSGTAGTLFWSCYWCPSSHIYHSKFRISENIGVRTKAPDKLTACGILGAVKLVRVDLLNVSYIIPPIHIVHLFKKKVLSRKKHINEKTETYINELKEMISDEESKVYKGCRCFKSHFYQKI